MMYVIKIFKCQRVLSLCHNSHTFDIQKPISNVLFYFNALTFVLFCLFGVFFLIGYISFRLLFTFLTCINIKLADT